tara:strand:- start:2093 stop:2602 length:510 start_codon:yes stop_codon:yes gene_type:complete
MNIKNIYNNNINKIYDDDININKIYDDIKDKTNKLYDDVNTKKIYNNVKDESNKIYDNIVKYNVIIFVVIYIIFTIGIIIYKKQHIKILNLFKDKMFVIQFLSIIFTIVIINIIINIKNLVKNDTKNKLSNSLKKATIAFIIAFFAENGFIFAPFYFVFLFSNLFNELF